MANQERCDKELTGSALRASLCSATSALEDLITIGKETIGHASALGGVALVLLGCSVAEPTKEYPGAAELYDSTRCRNCHVEHYDEWSASMHAYAARDPVFLAMNRRGQEETGGALGSLCVNCHAPLAVRTGATVDGLNLESVPESLQGVTCYFCHNAEAVEADHNNPLRLSDDVTMRGRIRDPKETSFHRSDYSPLLAGDQPESASLCGACHDIVLPSPPAPAPVALERTFAEWKRSVFAPENSPVPSAFSTCNSCHMPVVETAPIAPGGPPRARHSHHLAAVDGPLDAFPSTLDAARDARLAREQAADRERVLDATLRIEICLEVLSDDASAVHVTLDNASAGHNFPSGASQDRRAWAELIAYRGDEVLYSSGVVGEGGDVTELADPDLWLFRDETFDASGRETHMFFDVARIVEHTVPVQLTADISNPDYYLSHVVRRFPRSSASFIPGVPDRVTVRMRLTPVGFDVLADLIGSGHLDPTVRAAMPTLDLLPHRRLAAPEDSPLRRLHRVSMEFSEATLSSPLFTTREDFTKRPPWNCVGMTR